MSVKRLESSTSLPYWIKHPLSKGLHFKNYIVLFNQVNKFY